MVMHLSAALRKRAQRSMFLLFYHILPTITIFSIKLSAAQKVQMSSSKPE